MNSLEAQLKSWKPRRPSARISRRLFPAETGTTELAKALSWLVTATVCLLFTLQAVRNDDSGKFRNEPLVAMIWSNQTPPSYFLAETFQSENRVTRVTFASTNPGHSTSSVGFMRNTNSAD